MRLKATMLKHLLVLYLFFSFVLFTSAVPSTRSLKSSIEEISSVPYLVAQEEDLEGESLGEGFIERRMDLQKNDYPDPGPNKGHDPKVPGGP